MVKFIEDKYLPQVDYLTAASPLIAEAYQQLYKYLRPVVLNNVFSSSYLQVVTTSSPHKELNLFWFSQTIGKGRGLEDAIKAISLIRKRHISLTLLGSIDQAHQNYFSKLANELGLAENQLRFIAPVAPNLIFNMANKYDIGLALEQTTPLNKDICLANKVFTYLTAGLAIIATDTTAQKQFMSKYSSIGKTYPNGDIVALSAVINYYDEHRDKLNEARIAAYLLATEELNWEIEQQKFITIIKNLS
jgi:glycosyltransferase involved in cell wall biosynthesis